MVCRREFILCTNTDVFQWDRLMTSEGVQGENYREHSISDGSEDRVLHSGLKSFWTSTII
jgi:hypothetical protein